MDFYPLISDFFQRHLETTSLAVDGLAESYRCRCEQAPRPSSTSASCSASAWGGLRRRHRTGESAAPRRTQERPSLPVVELAEHHIESVETGVNWAGQQIQALGQHGDVAFVFAASLGEPEIQRLAAALEQRQVGAIWIGNRGRGSA